MPGSIWKSRPFGHWPSSAYGPHKVAARCGLRKRGNLRCPKTPTKEVFHCLDIKKQENCTVMKCDDPRSQSPVRTGRVENQAIFFKTQKNLSADSQPGTKCPNRGSVCSAQLWATASGWQFQVGWREEALLRARVHHILSSWMKKHLEVGSTQSASSAKPRYHQEPNTGSRPGHMNHLHPSPAMIAYP